MKWICSVKCCINLSTIIRDIILFIQYYILLFIHIFCKVVWSLICSSGRPIFCFLSAQLVVCFSVCLSIYLFLHFSVYLSVWLSVCFSICLSISLSIHLSMCLSFSLSAFPALVPLLDHPFYVCKLKEIVEILHQQWEHGSEFFWGTFVIRSLHHRYTHTWLAKKMYNNFEFKCRTVEMKPLKSTLVLLNVAFVRQSLEI